MGIIPLMLDMVKEEIEDNEERWPPSLSNSVWQLPWLHLIAWTRGVSPGFSGITQIYRAREVWSHAPQPNERRQGFFRGAVNYYHVN